MRFAFQHFAILGAARSGLAAARLAARNGAKVTLFDEGDPAKLATSIAAAQAEGFTIIVGQDAKDFAPDMGDFDLAILSPGFDVAWPLPAKFSAAGTPLTGEMEFGFTLNTTPIIAITGTNGKSTTTELIAATFTACGLPSVPCGNHGMALCEVLTSGQSYAALALEVSSFQLETIATFKPQISLWLNFAPDHLDRYEAEDAYYQAKFRIFENQDPTDLAIVNASEVEHLGPLLPRIVTFSAQPEHQDAIFTFRKGEFRYEDKVIGDASRITLRGRHNMENILAALAVGQAHGLAFSDMLRAIEAYQPPAHRCEFIRTWQQREFINDSKATNLHATESCIRSLDGTLVLIAGGKEKGLDYTPLREALPKKVRAIVLIGEIAPALTDLFADLVPCHQAFDMADAVRIAAAESQPGDTVVLSPGTSSFDMYTGYAQRGEAFRSAVLALG